MRKRAMTSANASRVKLSGHKNEEHFASAIGGRVQAGSHTDKKDVIDRRDRSHSVKAGTWWQIFLYGEERLRTNTIFQSIGNVAPVMVDCLNAYPPTFAQYQANKAKAKQALRPHMRALLAELNKPKIFKAFLDKALFDGGNAEFLSIFSGPASTAASQKHFHIFHKDDVTTILQSDLTLKNSQARHAAQTPEQKVVFHSAFHKKQIGEIEDRHDSQQHYREMKFRLNGLLVFAILQNSMTQTQQLRPNVTIYGKALSKFKNY